MNTSQLKTFAIRSRQILKEGVLNRIIALGFDIDGNLTVDRPQKIGGGTVFMEQIRDEEFYDAWIALEKRIVAHGVKEVCEEAAYTWFNRLVAIRIMQKNGFIEPVMAYTNEVTRIPVIVDEARTGRLSIQMSAAQRLKLNDLLMDPTKTNEQFSLLISAFCESNPVIFNCFGGIEKHIGLLLPDNILAQDGFIDLLNHTSYLTEDDYKQSELIGWLYQFYISERKDEVFAKKGKYDPDEIPAATQIFTPNWIVKYMVQNTLGRIYLDNNPYSSLGDEMKYLVKTDEKTPEDAILRINDMDGYTLIDPACGSGHILVEAFDLLFTMYQDEAYPVKAAITSILTKNIIGIDLDTRAKQLATFALLMKACQKDRSFLDCKVMPRVLDMPEPFVYEGGTMKDFLSHFFLGANNKILEETEKALDLMKDANTLGSIMKFDISDETRAAIQRSTEQWGHQEFINDSIKAVIPSMNIILALTDKYATTVMNPPYMNSSKFNSLLVRYSEKYYNEGKSDLFSIFMLVGMNLIQGHGKMSMINLPSWMFLSSFLSLRILFFKKYYFNSLLHLGRGIFGSDFGSVSFVVSKEIPQKKGYYRRLFKEHVQVRSVLEIKKLFETPEYGMFLSDQRNFSLIPDNIPGYWISQHVLSLFSSANTFGDIGQAKQGLATGDNKLFVREWFEINYKRICFNASSTQESIKASAKWFPYNKGGAKRRWYGNQGSVVDWFNDGEKIKNNFDEKGNLRSRPQNTNYYFHPSVSWGLITAGTNSFRYYPTGFIFDVGGMSLFCDKNIQNIVLGILNTKFYTAVANLINPTVNLQCGDVAKFPYLPVVSKDFEQIVSSCIGISKSDWDAHETSWGFKTNELVSLIDDNRTVASINGTPVQKYCMLKILLSAYKDKWADKFNQLHDNEEELNHQFIDIYGLQDELTPDVPLDEITILQQGEISIENNQLVWHDDVIIKQLLSYAIGCWMGRYRLDEEGLNIAHYPSPEEVCTYDYNGYKFEIDDDAIIPLMGKDTPFEDDNALQKIVNFVKMVFGEDRLTENLNFIEHCLGKTIEDYLIKDFWKDHKKMYQNRPIYWLFSSKKGAFQALAYMHRMNPYTAEKVRTKYLLPYIEHLKGKIEIDEARGFDLTTIERKNLVKMQAALEECIEYHDRLHEIAIQNIGFDLDDGVVVNYAKFGDVLAKIK